jgi:hypothetical protein
MKTRSTCASMLLAAVLMYGCQVPTDPDPPPLQTTPTPRPNTPPPAPVATPTPTPRPTATPVPPPPPTTTARMEWSLVDGCNDGRGIAVRLFDKTNNLLWPSASQYWRTGPGGSVDVPIACQRGARICYGAATDPQTTSYWGIGLDGRQGCDSCCFTCDDYRVSRTLVCG